MKIEIPVTTTGSNASATGAGSAASPSGELLAVYIDYHASAPNTTDVTITFPGNPATQTALTRSNSATDGWLYPRSAIVDNAGAAITNGHAPYVIQGSVIDVAVAGSNALTDCVTVYCYVRLL